MSDAKDVMRGKEAQAVLDNAAFQSAMASMKQSVAEQWKACPIRDREGQVLLLQLAKLCDKFEAVLIGMMRSGEFAQRKIDLNKERDEPKARQLMRKFTG